MAETSEIKNLSITDSEKYPVNFTSSALAYLKSLPDYARNKVFYFGDKPSGCSGYSYVAEFRSKTDYPMQFELEGLAIHIAPESLVRLKDMTIDLVREGINRKLVFQNPNQQGMCGCGESFSV